MIVYNYDADLEVSDTCVRSSLLSWVELSGIYLYGQNFNINKTYIQVQLRCLLAVCVCARLQNYMRVRGLTPRLSATVDAYEIYGPSGQGGWRRFLSSDWQIEGLLQLWHDISPQVVLKTTYINDDKSLIKSSPKITVALHLHWCIPNLRLSSFRRLGCRLFDHTLSISGDADAEDGGWMNVDVKLDNLKSW